MARPCGAHGGGKLATDSFLTESAPEASASEKLTMCCHRIQVKWTTAHFEALKYSILDFAAEFMHINEVRGYSVTHKVIVCYWNIFVWSLYGDGNTTSDRLESQVYPPQI